MKAETEIKREVGQRSLGSEENLGSRRGVRSEEGSVG